jgi:hypothetical protein
MKFNIGDQKDPLLKSMGIGGIYSEDGECWYDYQKGKEGRYIGLDSRGRVVCATNDISEIMPVGMDIIQSDKGDVGDFFINGEFIAKSRIEIQIEGIVVDGTDHLFFDSNNGWTKNEALEKKLRESEFQERLQKFCDGVAVAMVGDYKNSTEVLVYATMGDAEAQKFAAWYNAVWDSKASLTSPPQDIDGWISNLPKFKGE